MACDTYVMNKSFINPEYEKKKELERRRKLRLLQVRQQSKDFSDRLRAAIQAEAVRKRNAAAKCKIQTIRDRQEEELKHLKDMYGMCLQSVGTSHREAAKQPDINLILELETAQKSKEAAIRGCKAKKQQFVEKSLNYQKMYAPIQQKIETRNRENMRSFFVSCLPQKSTTHKKSSRSPKKLLQKRLEPKRNLEIVTEIPSNLTVPQSKSSCYPDNKDSAQTGLFPNSFVENLDQINKQRSITVPSKLEEDYNSVREPRDECSGHYLVCSCHLPLHEKGIRRRCQSESSISSESSEAKKPKLRSRSCSPPQSVRTLNYCTVGNVYESKEPNFAEVKHHPKHSDIKLLKDPDATALSGLTLDNKDKNEELRKKTEERCSKALQREQLKKDFLQLLQDLKNVNREKLISKSRSKSKTQVYQRERDILKKNESKQKKLADAFETLLQTVKQAPVKNKGLLTKTQQSTLDLSSPPTLNLATYQQINMENCARQRRIIRPEEGTDICNPQTESPGQLRYGGERECSDQYQYSGCRGQQYSEGGQYYNSGQRSISPYPVGYSQESNRDNRRDFPSPVGYSQESNRDNRRDFPSPVGYSQELNPDNRRDILYPAGYSQNLNCDKPQKFQHPNHSPESGTSYISLPEHLTPSQQSLLDRLLAQVKKKGLKSDLKLYIQRLLNMSRESIENLPTSPSIDRARNPTPMNVEDSIRRVAEMVNCYADRINDLVNTFEVLENCGSPSLHMNLPEHIVPDLPRHMATPEHESFPISPSASEQNQIELRERRLFLGPNLNPVRRFPSEQHTMKLMEKWHFLDPNSAPFSPRSESSPYQNSSSSYPTSKLADKIGSIQTPFGISSNLLPKPGDSIAQFPTPSQPPVQPTLSRISEGPEYQMNSSSPGNDSHDDSTSWAFVGLPKPPVRPPGAPPIDENALFKEKLGHLPGEGCNQLDISNITAEMERLRCEINKFGSLMNEDQCGDDIGVSTQQPANRAFQDDHCDEMGFYNDGNQCGKYVISKSPSEQNKIPPKSYRSPRDDCNPAVDSTANCIGTTPFDDSFPLDSSLDLNPPIDMDKIKKLGKELSFISTCHYSNILKMLKEENKFEENKANNLVRPINSETRVSPSVKQPQRRSLSCSPNKQTSCSLLSSSNVNSSNCGRYMTNTPATIQPTQSHSIAIGLNRLADKLFQESSLSQSMLNICKN